MTISDWWFTYPGAIAIGTYIGVVGWITKWWVERKDKHQ